MPFLTETDYEVQIRNWVKQIITQYKTDVLHQAELAAQAEMESYLRQRYDVAQIYSRQDEERNALIVLYMIDITLYHLHSNISADNIPELRIIRYNSAKEWLKAVAKGDVSPDLPENVQDQDESSGFQSVEFGSREKYSERF